MNISVNEATECHLLFYDTQMVNGHLLLSFLHEMIFAISKLV